MVLLYLIQSLESKVLQFLQHLISWHYYRLTSSSNFEEADRNPARTFKKLLPRPLQLYSS